jgi:hypothetical protein
LSYEDFFSLALLYFFATIFLAQFLVGKFISPNHKNLLMAHNYYLLINQPLNTNYYEQKFQNWRRNPASNFSNRL